MCKGVQTILGLNKVFVFLFIEIPLLTPSLISQLDDKDHVLRR